MSLLRKALTVTAVTLLSLAGAALPVGSAGAVRSAATGGLVSSADPPGPKKLFTVGDARVKQPSGLAKSQKYEGIWWTVKSSGDSARIFGLNQDGKVVAVLRFKAPVRDVEAIAVDRDGAIHVADIGDGKANRDMIAVYTVPEPAQLGDQQVKYHRYDFTYPDGAHDAETLLIQPETRRLYFVTKVLKGAGAFYAAPEQPSRQGTNKLTRLAAAPAGITDGMFLSDGKRVVLRSHVDIASVTWGKTPKVMARAAVPLARGGSVAVGPSRSTVLVGSEGANSVVYEVRIPVRKAGTPTADASSKPAAGDGDTAKKNHNLRWILVGAGLFALFVAVVTFPAGRRERLDRMAENARLTGQPPPDRHRRRSTV